MSAEIYTPEQFAKSLAMRGYMKKYQAEKYVRENPKDEYKESDFEIAYRDINRECMRANPIKGLASDGRNMFDAQYWK